MVAEIFGTLQKYKKDEKPFQSNLLGTKENTQMVPVSTEANDIYSTTPSPGATPEPTATPQQTTFTQPAQPEVSEADQINENINRLKELQEQQQGVQNVTMTDTSTQIEKGYKAPEALVKQQKDLLDQQKQIAEGEAQFQQAESNISLEDAQKRAAKQAEYFNKQDQLKKDFDKNYGELSKTYSKAKDDFSKMEVSTDKFWNERGGNWGKMGAAFLVAISQMTKQDGQPNMALNILNDSIKQNIELQKFDVGKKRDELSLIKNDLTDLTAKFKDEQVAEQALFNIYFDQLTKELEASVAKLKATDPNSPIAINKQKLLNQIEQEKVNNDLKLDQLAQNKVTTQINTKQQQVKTELDKGGAKDLGDMFRKDIEVDNDLLKANTNLLESIKTAGETGGTAATQNIIVDWVKAVYGGGQNLNVRMLQDSGMDQGLIDEIGAVIEGIKGKIDGDKLEQLKDFARRKNKIAADNITKRKFLYSAQAFEQGVPIKSINFINNADILKPDHLPEKPE
jgi:hypothetical protein